MKVLTSISLLFMIICTFSCGSPSPFVPETYDKEYITFGNGGGVTGAVTQFYLLSDGRAYKKISPDSLLLLGKVDRKICNHQFDTFNNWGLKDLKINDPGNRYFFVDSNSSNNRLTWGGNQQQPNHILLSFHANLSRLVKDLNKD